MQSKREFGQYFTIENPFNHPLFNEWMILTGYKDEDVILEPFAGANNILRLMDESGYHNRWKCYDIEPAEHNAFPLYNVEFRDTIKEFPSGYKVCVTNCPYLGKSSAKRRKINYPWEEDDLYKVCLNRMLDKCDYVAVIIPESFVTANIHTDRLYGIVSLACKMFYDTECPVCLALFTPTSVQPPKIYSNNEYLGTLNELTLLDEKFYNDVCDWKFNDKYGSIGAKTIDSQNSADCQFFDGSRINPDKIKVSSRSFTRISGLPDNVDLSKFIAECNKILEEYRLKTKDTAMTSFKGLRKDGKYRRRLDFKTVRWILNKAFVEVS